MKNTIIFVFLSFFWLACNDTDAIPEKREAETPADTSNQVVLRFLALGDSYTIGESVSHGERWPAQLVDELETSGFIINDLEIIAQTGWTTSELAAGIASEDPQGSYDLVGLLIGVNNQYRQLDTADYRDEFSVLLQQAIAFAGNDPAKVIVVSIPDYSVTAFAQQMDTARIAREIDAYNAINFEESSNARVNYIDITPVSRQAKNDLSLIAADGLHPSGRMYKQWVILINPVAIEILQESQSEKKK